MPTYEYKCGSCNHEFEIDQNIKDEPLKKCEKCEQESLRRLVSGAGFVLRGDGWFKTGGY